MDLKRLSLIAFIAVAFNALGQQYRIEYRWLNFPCGEILNCDAGCSACNIPDASGGGLMGTNAAWIGVQTCPLPVTVADNAIYTAGWPLEPGPDHSVIFNGLALVPVRIDSIRFRHAIYQDGPQRVKVLYTNDVAQPLQEIADQDVPATWTNVTLDEVGSVVVPEGNAFGTFQIRFQPYQGGSGGWALDELIISASPLIDSQTGIAEVHQRTAVVRGPLFDVMGRPVGSDRAPGIYQHQGRRIVQVE